MHSYFSLKYVPRTPGTNYQYSYVFCLVIVPRIVDRRSYIYIKYAVQFPHSFDRGNELPALDDSRNITLCGA